jgi:glycosyltransferase involved in cell wall biosynthesis
MRRRLRMVQVTHLDGPGGGPRSLVRHMLFYLAEFDSVILHGGSGLIANMCDRVGIPHRQLHLDKKRWLGIGFIQLVRWFWKIRPDVVILHGQWAGPVGALAARLAGIRNMLYVVQWPAFYTDWDPLRILRNFFSEKIPCRLAARVITLCEGPRYQFLYRGLCPPDKILSIPNPLSHAVLPTPEERGAVRERWGWGEKEVHVVSVGRLVDQKRVDWLIRAWRAVAREGVQARLWIVGDGPERAGLERLSEEFGLGGQIRFLGEQKNGWAFLAAADIAVMTTAYEGLGNVVPEALAAGVPVVVSDADGPRDVVTEGREGFLVPPGDIAGMAARILQLARDPELRARMGLEGKRKAEEFDGNRILRQYVSVIEDLAFSPSVGRG